MLILWIIIFIASLSILIKGSDWLIGSAEKIGLAVGLSPFIVGVTIVGIGTSLPELISSFVAVFQGVGDVVTANAIGSNIANILLIIGISAIIGRKLVVSKSLIDLDLPLLAISTVILVGVASDQIITVGESILMFVTYIIYLIYTATYRDDNIIEDIKNALPNGEQTQPRPKISKRDILMLFVGIVGLVLGAKYLIEALIIISTMLDIGVGVITITAVAIGTSLPELVVSAKAAMKNKSEIAIGNIFGSNVFNSLMVVGLPGLLGNLPVDAQTFSIGLPTMAAATFLFVISGISKRIHIWEGAFYLSLYILFVAKLFNWF
jgi:cation:H+ antiporter